MREQEKPGDRENWIRGTQEPGHSLGQLDTANERIQQHTQLTNTTTQTSQTHNMYGPQKETTLDTTHTKEYTLPMHHTRKAASRTLYSPLGP